MSNQPMHHYDDEDMPQDTPGDAVELYKGALQNLDDAPEQIIKATNKATRTLGGLLAWMEKNNLTDQARDVQHAYAAFNDLLDIVNRYDNADTNARMAVNMLRKALQQATMELDSLLESARQGNTMDARLREVVEQAREDIREEEQDFGWMQAEEDMMNDIIHAMEHILERPVNYRAGERVLNLICYEADGMTEAEKDALRELFEVVLMRYEHV